MKSVCSFGEPMHVLNNLETGAVRCVFSSAPLATIQSLLAWGTTRPDGERIVVCEVDLSRPVYSIVDDFVDSLARAALAVWPDWYDSANFFVQCDESSLQSALDRLASSRAARHLRSVLRPWVLRAASMCRINTPPVVSDVSPTVQLQQLSLAIANSDLTLVVRVLTANETESIGLLGLARNLEWLSRHVSARIVAVLPVAWSGRAELDCISWDYRTVDKAEPIHPEADSALDGTSGGGQPDSRPATPE
jgi:hypothetical protein